MVKKVTEEKDGMAGLNDEYWRRAWPVPLTPQEDELLSSWLVRLSEAHGLTFSNFCRAVWPKKGVRLLELEILPKAEVLNTLAAQTRTPVARVEATTLTGYDGWLFIDPSPRKAQWILRFESLRQGWAEIEGEGAVLSYFYFDALYHLLGLLLRPRSKCKWRSSFQQQAFERYGLSLSELVLPEKAVSWNFMRLPVAVRRGLLNLASQLLADWPNEFLDFCRANNFSYTDVGRFHKTLPYWFHR